MISNSRPTGTRSPSTTPARNARKSPPPSAASAPDNAIGLDPEAEYHAYEFWTDTYLGKLPGTARLARELEPNHCAMISVRKVVPNPQVVSTNRHLLQGWVDLTDVTGMPPPKPSSGTARVIGGDPFHIVIAHNGAKPATASAIGGGAELKAHPADGLGTLVLTARETTDVKWSLSYK